MFFENRIFCSLFCAVFLRQDIKTKSLVNAYKSFFVHLCGKKMLAWGQPGDEPETSSTRCKNHARRPLCLWEKVKFLCRNIF